MLGAYAAAKTALWAQSVALREELGTAGRALTALHIGFMNTEMIADLDPEKIAPAVVADMALDGVEHGAFEVLTDELTGSAKAGLSVERVGGEPNLFAAYLWPNRRFSSRALRWGGECFTAEAERVFAEWRLAAVLLA